VNNFVRVFMEARIRMISNRDEMENNRIGSVWLIELVLYSCDITNMASGVCLPRQQLFPSFRSISSDCRIGNFSAPYTKKKL
jgi:hypothetical protein